MLDAYPTKFNKYSVQLECKGTPVTKMTTIKGYSFKICKRSSMVYIQETLIGAELV